MSAVRVWIVMSYDYNLTVVQSVHATREGAETEAERLRVEFSDGSYGVDGDGGGGSSGPGYEVRGDDPKGGAETRIEFLERADQAFRKHYRPKPANEAW